MFTIDTDKEIPTTRGSGRKPKYPWREMAVGDSFFVPLTDQVASPRRLQSNLIASASSALGSGKITTSTVTEDGKEGVRVWRTG